jgi:transposase, IS30 family
MPITYSRLTDFDREEISRGLASGESMTRISARIGRSTSAISREVGQNGGVDGYRANLAARRARRKASSRKFGHRKLGENPVLFAAVVAGLRNCWSPDQIAKVLRSKYPGDLGMQIAPETIYQYIYVLPRGSLKAALIKGLRQERKYRRKRNTKASQQEETRGKIADMLSIEERPAEIEGRIIPGHWEGDLIMGKSKQSAMGTLVERTTRYVIMVPLKAKDAVSVRKAYAKEIKTVPKEIAKTLTYDQGKEMSDHKTFTLSTGMQVYFAHPGSPWERGTNENTNGLIRQYFPKGTDLRTVSTKEIKRVQRQLNQRPRKAINYLTPEEAINKLVALEAGN